MDFKGRILEFLASLIFFFRNCLLIIFFPYKSIRKIVLSPDRMHLYFFFSLSFIYFIFQEVVRPVRFNAFFTFLIFIASFYFLVVVLRLLMQMFGKEVEFRKIEVGYSYTLLPTLIWFFTNLFLYVFFPPPRTTSFLGVSFSVLYLSFSGTMLLWKLILVYLVVRFVTGFKFFKIWYLLILIGLVFAPYFFLLYYFKIFRVPFI